jgi:release factor H-coupled RctB family protein
VICEDRELLYEEAPEAYKKIDDVVQDMTAFGLIRPVAVLRPLITYKVRRTDEAG